LPFSLNAAAAFGADDTGVKAHPANFTGHPAIFDFWTTVHDNRKAGIPGFLGGGRVAHTQLHPKHLGRDRNGSIGVQLTVNGYRGEPVGA
jgi:hypothetical protein